MGWQSHAFTIWYRHQAIWYFQSQAAKDQKGHGVVWEEDKEGCLVTCVLPVEMEYHEMLFQLETEHSN